MSHLIGKKAKIAIDDLNDKGLFIEDPVEILDQDEIEHELIGRRVAIKVKSLVRPEYQAWILKSEVVSIRD